MNDIAMLIAGLVVLPAVGLVAWIGFAMTQANEELRSFVGFEGMHFNE